MHTKAATIVDEIRDAADRIRANVAEIARPDDRWTQGPGQQLHAGYTAHVAADGDPQWSGICDVIVGSGAEKHIAAWDPAVALAVADWLNQASDDAAHSYDIWRQDKYGEIAKLGGVDAHMEAMYRHPLAVARAYLGTP